MNNNLFFGISLTASFLAGTLALFAPCCITFLFPAYLGTIFKEGKRVMFYTFIFALGLSAILIPVALGFRLLITLFNLYHQVVYYFGAIFLILMGLLTFKPIFHLPQFFHPRPTKTEKINSFSVFSLGVVSGITSACCAPVLFAAVTLTSLSPTLFQATFVAGAYVLGIVFPLFLLSLFYQTTVDRVIAKRRQQIYFVLKIIGASIFVVTGFLLGILNYLGKIQMYQMEGYSQMMRRFVFSVAGYFQNPIIDILTFSTLVFIFYKLLRRAKRVD